MFPILSELGTPHWVISAFMFVELIRWEKKGSKWATNTEHRLVVFHCLLTPCSGLKSVECLIDVDVSKIRMNYSTVEDHHDSPELLQYRADLPDDRQMYKLKMKLGRKAYRELLKGQR